jgi:hypothetical protein
VAFMISARVATLARFIIVITSAFCWRDPLLACGRLLVPARLLSRRGFLRGHVFALRLRSAEVQVFSYQVGSATIQRASEQVAATGVL